MAYEWKVSPELQKALDKTMKLFEMDAKQYAHRLRQTFLSDACGKPEREIERLHIFYSTGVVLNDPKFASYGAEEQHMILDELERTVKEAKKDIRKKA